MKLKIAKPQEKKVDFAVMYNAPTGAA